MATSYAGYMGKVVELDLTTREVREYPWTDEDRRKYIGGKTMAAKVLDTMLTGREEAFSEENPLIISTGPLTDTLALIALKHKEKLLERAYSVIQDNRTVIQEWLREEPLCSVVLPEFSTVSFMKYEADIPSETLALDLLRQDGVFFVPGDCFFHGSHLRLSLTADPEVMKQGLTLLSRYLHRE